MALTWNPGIGVASWIQISTLSFKWISVYQYWSPSGYHDISPMRQSRASSGGAIAWWLGDAGRHLTSAVPSINLAYIDPASTWTSWGAANSDSRFLRTCAVVCSPCCRRKSIFTQWDAHRWVFTFRSLGVRDGGEPWVATLKVWIPLLGWPAAILNWCALTSESNCLESWNVWLCLWHPFTHWNKFC